MDYHLMEYSNQNVDPYKLILTKILGRCGLIKKTYPEVIKASEDYLWLQVRFLFLTCESKSLY
jgi:nuclear pore complex protein Nup93